MSNASTEKTTHMDPKLKAKWVKALLSGKYKQGKARLYRSGEDSYCCLGVLACEMGKSKDEITGMSFLDDIFDYLDDPIHKDDQRALAMLNDGDAPFELIAGVINEWL